MNGTSLQKTLSVHDTLGSASNAVLETMFFTESVPMRNSGVHLDPVACQLQCSGAENGTFSVAVDRSALVALCESFYGAMPSATQPFELLCEFTNMIAGSTLSLYSPSQLCPLSSPQLCDIATHLAAADTADATLLWMGIEGGLLSIACSLRTS